MSNRKEAIDALERKIDDLSNQIRALQGIVSKVSQDLSGHINESSKSSATSSLFSAFYTSSAIATAEKAQFVSYWKGLIIGLLGGIFGNLLTSYLVKLYEFLGYPLEAWVWSTIATFLVIAIAILYMWIKSKQAAKSRAIPRVPDL
jgi:uncharacterized BrkB/YihY/UPF0761 family membrane protein